MERVVEPELLDELPPDDPRAIKSRRDLRRLNTLMANAVHIARALTARPKPGRVMDLGSGDGTLSLELARRLKWRGTEFMLRDRLATIPGEVRQGFKEVGCPIELRQWNALAGFSEMEKADVAFANLFLHHFTREELIQLLASIAQRCGFFVACEPRRSKRALLGSHCVGILGCNAVTRHDAVVSVRAGFSGNELSQMWPRQEDWLLTERPAGLFSHLFIATKL